LFEIFLVYRVTFTFKPSKKSNNGTDVNAGQLPQILFRVIAHDAPSSKPHSSIETVHSISSNFSKVVTPVKILSFFENLVGNTYLFIYNIPTLSPIGFFYGFAQFNSMGLVGIKSDDYKWSYWSRSES
jgi:hypothetical protein